MNPKISIIVPVYNTEKYLPRCLNSLVNQTLEDIEIIVVNDGSTDNCLEIIRKFAKEDTRIKIVESANNGVGSARNLGMQLAQGNYIGFVDSDDWVEKDMFNILYQAAKFNSANKAFCNYIREFQNGDSQKVKIALNGDALLEKNEILEIIFKYYFGIDEKEMQRFKHYYKYCENYNSVCNCIYNIDIIRNNKLSFVDYKKYDFEDLIFNLEYAYYCNKIFICDQYLYHYSYNNQSLTNTYNSNLNAKKINSYNYLRNFIISKKLGKEYNKRLDYRIFCEIPYVISNYINTDKISFQEKIYVTKEMLDSKLLDEAKRNINITALPFSLRKLFYHFLKYKRYRSIFLLLSMHNKVKALFNAIKQLR